MHLMPRAFSFPLASDGRSIPARIAMMAMTTSNSINVNACGRVLPAWIMRRDCSETLRCQASARRIGNLFALAKDNAGSLRKVVAEQAVDFGRPVIIARIDFVGTDFVLMDVVTISAPA